MFLLFWFWLVQVRGLTPFVGATLVVALDWAGTRPAPTVTIAPRNPKEPYFAGDVWANPGRWPVARLSRRYGALFAPSPVSYFHARSL